VAVFEHILNFAGVYRISINHHPLIVGFLVLYPNFRSLQFQPNLTQSTNNPFLVPSETKFDANCHYVVYAGLLIKHFLLQWSCNQITINGKVMKNKDRLILIKEGLYYILGILLISGFVYLYWGHFTDSPGPPAAIRYIMGHWGMRAAIIINAAVFLLFILFLPFRDRIEWRSKGMLSAFILALFAEMFGVPLLIFLLQPLGADYRLWDTIEFYFLNLS